MPRFIAILCACVMQVALAEPSPRPLTVASTTSTEQSGLFAHLLPRFRAETGIEVRVIAVGTGQAFAIARRGDADVLLVHDREGERAFLAEGHGISAREVMHNDFVVLGPAADPAAIRGLGAVEAFARIADRQVLFASRGDDSGTHRAERRLWESAGVRMVRGRWYRELGAGMGAALNVAADLDAYLLADRASWASFRNRRGLTLLVEGDPVLRNPYTSILLDPARHPHLNHPAAQRWHDWLQSPSGRDAIDGFRVDGERLFVPSDPPATRDGSATDIGHPGADGQVRRLGDPIRSAPR